MKARAQSIFSIKKVTARIIDANSTVSHRIGRRNE